MEENLLSTVRDYIEINAREKAKANFISCPHTNQNISNDKLKHNLDKINYYLVNKKKLKKKSIICTLTENSLSSIQLMLGIMYSGMVQVPLNLVAGEDQLAYIIEHSESKIIFSTKNNIELAEKIIKKVSTKIELVEIDKNNFLEEINNDFHVLDSEINKEDNALLMYTSGTTGKPKGVMLSHENLLHGGKNVMISHELTSTDKALCVLPLYHINGLIVTVMGPLVSQSSLILCEKFSASNFWKYISQFKCTWFSVVPTIISALINKYSKEEFDSLDTSSIRFGRSASAALAPETHRNFEEKFNIQMIETMGLTESCAPILANPLPPKKIKYGSPGIPYGNDVTILDNDFNEAKRNNIGQICVKGKNVMKEYYKNPIETKKSFYKGWFLTGDLGLMDDEDFVFVRGRIKELIIKGGENISPREIDDVLYQHPKILEAAAFSVECSHYGEKIEAGVVLKDKEIVSEEELLKHCIGSLGKYKSPNKIHFFKELPKGSSGKIQRLKIKDIIKN
ncbi:AMP-binding protein [Candidatus Pelagibacter ubique]|nr:AMP-binding protein [Candidatus Pelagibacter ubique]